MRLLHWLFFWIFGLVASLYLLGSTHEVAHQQICREFYGKSTTSGYSLDGQFLKQTTTCDLPNMTEARRNAFDIADSSGEWSYLLQSIIFTLFFCVFLLKVKDD
jgi:hypothetical protein